MLRSRTLALTAAAGLCACALVPAGPLGTAQGLTVDPAETTAATTDTLRSWVAQYMERGATVTSTEAVADARNFDVIFAHKKDYAPYIPEMKAANPSVQIIAYFNGTFTKKSELSSFAESDFAHDRNGKRIKHNSFELWLMNPSSAKWVTSRVNLCKTLMSENDYNACGVDNIGPAMLAPGYTSGIPVNPATGKVYTGSEWLKATTALSNTIKNAISPKPLYGNSLGNGAGYFKVGEPTKQLLNGLSGATVEGFVRGGRDPLNDYPSVTQWKQNVDMLIDAGNMGKPLMTVTKTWNTGTQAQKDAWHRFALSTFMLGTNGVHKFWFTYQLEGEQTNWHPYWNTNIGSPTGAYYTSGSNVYQRNFAAGKVVVNPDSVSRTVSLGGSYKTLSGATVTSVTLPPHSGEVLRKV